MYLSERLKISKSQLGARSDAIQTTLRSSDFLGVICGPDPALALWPQVLRSLKIDRWPKETFKLTPKS